MITIRSETPADYGIIRTINCKAFGGYNEGRLVDTLREERHTSLSLIALNNADAIGHILFSALPIHTCRGNVPAVSLAPMAVLPEYQKHGVGTALVQAGLAECRALRIMAVIVLGHPDYYIRFGFSAALAKNIRSPFSEEGDAWMALELMPGALLDIRGEVHYPPAFGIVS